MKEAVLVTGGAGFIGSNITELLLDLGHKVVILDNLSSGKKENLREFTKRIVFVEGDIRDYGCLSDVVKKYKIDFITHQAALVSVIKSIQNPKLNHDINVTGTLNILLAAKENKVKHVVLASSAGVYGDSPKSPKTEEMTVNPLSPYASSKAISEIYAKNFSDLYGLSITVLRYFNVFGKKQDPNGEYAAAIPKFVNLSLENKTITIYGDGSQTRDFISVLDVANANLLALKNTSKTTQIINISSGKGISILKTAKLIIKLCNSKSKIKFTHPRTGEIINSVGDNTKAKKVLGFTSKITFEKGLKETIEWYKNPKANR